MPITIPVPAGKMVSSDGNQYFDYYPPGYTLTTDFGKTYTGNGSSTPETSILNGGAALTGLFPAAVAIGDRYDIRLRGTVLNSSGTNTFTSTIKIYYGSAYTVMSQATPQLTSNATERLWAVDLSLVVEVVGAVNVAKYRMFGHRVGFNAVIVPGTGWDVLATSSQEFFDGGSSGTNANLATNAANDFNVTATHSNNTVSMSTKLNLCQVSYCPKNY